jgi:hypothetical protein
MTHAVNWQIQKFLLTILIKFCVTKQHTSSLQLNFVIIFNRTAILQHKWRKGFCGLARFPSPQNENEKCHVVILVAVDEKKYEYKLSWFGVVRRGEEINLTDRFIWGNGGKMKKKCSKIDGGNIEAKNTCETRSPFSIMPDNFQFDVTTDDKRKIEFSP